MKTTLQFLSVNAQADWHRQVDERLQHLHGLTPITEAEVILEHQRDRRPPFRVRLRLEVPGPGPHLKATRHDREAALLIPGPELNAEATDNTLEAALLKATNNLEQQLISRELRKSRRGKSQLQLSSFSSRWTQSHTRTSTSAKSGRAA